MLFFFFPKLGFLICSGLHSLQFPHSLMLVSSAVLVALPAVMAQAPWQMWVLPTAAAHGTCPILDSQPQTIPDFLNS